MTPHVAGTNPKIRSTLPIRGTVFIGIPYRIGLWKWLDSAISPCFTGRRLPQQGDVGSEIDGELPILRDDELAVWLLSD